MSNDIARISVLFTAVIVLLTGCGSRDGSDNDLTDTTARAMRIGVIPVDECLPVYVAEHLGLLDSLHADVRVVRFDAMSECRKALTARQVDIIVNDTAIGYKFLTSKKARIHRVSQLSDKVIAADGEGFSKQIAQMGIDSLLKLKRHIFIIKVEDLGVRTRMLMSSNVDAAVLPEPWASQAVKAGAVKIDIKAIKPGTPQSSFPNTKNARLLSAIATATDSINKYGKENYYPLFNK